MPLEAASYVTDVPYAQTFVRELAPAWLDHVALLSGFAPPSRDRKFAWCDLGCGQGMTATILAATHRAGRFCGIDFMATHIENARCFAKECGIDNVEFHCADFATAIDTDFGGFDYIVSHGVYSWVNEQTQNALQRFIDRYLKPGGLAYVSYYTIPGRAVDVPTQRLTRTLGLTLPGDSASRCAAAIEIVKKLIELKAPALVASPMAMYLKERSAGSQLAYLSHELMLEHWQPLCVTDVRATMRQIGLLPAGSATLVDNYDSFVLGQASRQTLAAIVDPDTREFARDFLIDQFFRRDIFIRHSRTLDEDERHAKLLGSYFSLMRPVNTIEYKMQTPAGQLRYDNAAARKIIATLASGPRPLIDICDESDLGPKDGLANALVLCAADVLRPVERSWIAIENLNDAIYRRLGGPTEVRYLVLPFGTALPIDSTLQSLIKGDESTKNEEGHQWREFLRTHGVRLL